MLCDSVPLWNHTSAQMSKFFPKHHLQAQRACGLGTVGSPPPHACDSHLNLMTPTVNKPYNPWKSEPPTCLLSGAQSWQGYLVSSPQIWAGICDWSWSHRFQVHATIHERACIRVPLVPPSPTTVTEKQNEWHLQVCFPGGDPIDHNWHLLKHSLAEKYLLILPPSRNANKYARGSRRWGGEE